MIWVDHLKASSGTKSNQRPAESGIGIGSLPMNDPKLRESCIRWVCIPVSLQIDPAMRSDRYAGTPVRRLTTMLKAITVPDRLEISDCPTANESENCLNALILHERPEGN